MIEVDALNSNTGYSDRIRPEWRSTSEDPHLFITTKSWWSNSRFPVGSHRLMKNKNQPEMRKSLKSTNGIYSSEFCLKHQLAPGLIDQARLPWHPEFFTITGANVANYFNIHYSKFTIQRNVSEREHHRQHPTRSRTEARWNRLFPLWYRRGSIGDGCGRKAPCLQTHGLSLIHI